MNVPDATQNSWKPFIGRALGSIPKAITIGVGFGAALSGISNICSAAPAAGVRLGGGLQTEANELWRSNWAPNMQACLGQPWVHQFKPDRAVVECVMRETAKWEEADEDGDAKEVVERGVAHHRLKQPCDAAQDRTRPTPDTMKNALREARSVVRGMDAFDPTMERVESELWFYSPLSGPELGDATEPYTVDRLITLLNESVGLGGFKEQTSALSFELHEMFKSAGDLIYRLKPELMRAPADLAAFEKKLNNHFVADQNAGMNDRQLRILLSHLAKYMNNKYSLQSS